MEFELCAVLNWSLKSPASTQQLPGETVANIFSLFFFHNGVAYPAGVNKLRKKSSVY